MFLCKTLTVEYLDTMYKIVPVVVLAIRIKYKACDWSWNSRLCQESGECKRVLSGMSREIVGHLVKDSQCRLKLTGNGIIGCRMDYVFMSRV